jgi:hypothetical protein
LTQESINLIQRHEVLYSVSGDFDPLPEFGARIQQAVMPILGIADGQLIAYGTGFMVAGDGLMMTAKHVIQHAWSQRVRRFNERGQFYDHCELYALYVTNERHPDNDAKYVGGLWPINKAWFSLELDIAFCWLRSATRDSESIRFPIFRLSPGIPKLGERVIGFGYYKMEGSKIEQGTTRDDSANYSQMTAHSAGRIVEVFPKKRDSGMLNFPCFLINARFDPGMSGGPVCNESGYVCGVICSSMPKFEGDPGYVSYVSLIWPAMGTQVEVAIDGGKPELRLIYELVTKGFIETDDTINNLQISIGSDGKRTVSILSNIHE